MKTQPTGPEGACQLSRLCAHRGFNAIAPENTLLAFDAAIKAGAGEIEMDLWPTADGKIVVCHDPTVDRTTDGAGRIEKMAYSEISKLDAGISFPENYGETRIPLFEEVLDRFAGKAVMNLHIKSRTKRDSLSPAMRKRGEELAQAYRTGAVVRLSDQQAKQVLPEEKDWEDDQGVPPYDPASFRTIVDLIDRYGCRDAVYFTGGKDVLLTAEQMAPDIDRCCLEGHMNYTIVENALKYHCRRVQFCKLYLTEGMIREAHENHLICNLFWSDNLPEALQFFDQGIDVILSNHISALAGK